MRKEAMVALAVPVLMRDGVAHAVETVHVRTHADRFLLDARIDFGDDLHFGFTALTLASISFHQVRDGVDAKVHPSAEVGIAEVTDAQIRLGVESGFGVEGGDGVIVEIHVDLGRSCANPARRADPDVLVALGDPERHTASKDGWLAGNLA
jgi:hypothetical protein